MLKVIIFIAASVGALAEIAPQQCSVNPDGTSTCSGSDQASLIQSRVRVSLDADSESEVLKEHVYGPYATSTSMLTYFAHWAQGAIDSRLARIVPTDAHGEELSDEDLESLDGNPAVSSPGYQPAESDDDEATEDLSTLETESKSLSAEVAAELFEAKVMQDCPEMAMALLEGGRIEFQVLHALPADKKGIRHALLKGKGGQLQYIASYVMPDGKHEALVVDPPACSATGQLSLLEAEIEQGIPNISSSDPVDPNVAKKTRGNTTGGEADVLALDDPLVLDCKMLFVRTVQENCHKTVDVSVTQAQRLVVDGIAVQMKVQVCKKDTHQCHLHRPECAFETSTNHTDNSLLQTADPTNGTLPEEDLGLVATLRLHVPLCDADTAAGVDGDDAVDDGNLLEYSLGENSGYKGFEHVYDNMPVYSALEVDTSGDVDFRTKYPACYPAESGKGAGTETVRNQGTCGSCWAFASATATMANLCATDTTTGTQKSLKSATDRYEVSVQRIISCPDSNGNGVRGCNGGNMAIFDGQAKRNGLTKERDNLYKCGAGDPKKHFSKKNACDKYPWGGQCTGAPNPMWWWGGAARVDGEAKMMTFIASGMSLYVSMDIYNNFFQLRKGVYSATTGSKKGGHAMNGCGYGVDGGTKYWLLQNSWGSNGWGDSGYGKVLRGTNLAGVERGAFAPRVWVTGGKQPVCQDSLGGSGVSSTGGAPFWSCKKSQRYCAKYAVVKASCPKTCNACGGTNGANAPQNPTAKPTVKPAPGGKKKCCSGSCSSTSDCGPNLFCCPNHNMCMDKSTGGNWGANCKICTNGGKPLPTPAPTPAPPPAPAGSKSCGFESTQSIWKDQKSAAGTNLQFSWTRKQRKTPSGGTGPDKAAEGNYYMYIEASSPRKKGDKAILGTTTGQLGKGAYLEFAYHMMGRDIGELSVWAKDSSQPVELWKKVHAQGKTWKKAFVALDKYAGKTVKLGIMGIRGKNWQGDIAIDDVTLYEGAAGGTPAPPPAATTAPPPAATTAPPPAATTAPPPAATTAPPVATTGAPPAATTGAPPPPTGGSTVGDKVDKLAKKVDEVKRIEKQILGKVR